VKVLIGKGNGKSFEEVRGNPKRGKRKGRIRRGGGKKRGSRHRSENLNKSQGEQGLIA